MAKTKVLTDVGVSALVDETKKYVKSQGIGVTEDDINGLIDAKLVSVNESIENKVEKEEGKSLSTNDYTTIEKEKLATISEGAEVNVQSNWNVTDETSDAFIKNKPISLPANGGNADTVNGHSVETDVPSGAKFTDTVYNDSELVERVETLETNTHTHSNKSVLDATTASYTVDEKNKLNAIGAITTTQIDSLFA